LVELNSLKSLPRPSSQNIALRVTPEAEKALLHGHPWLFDQAITYQSHSGLPGDLAIIFNQKRRFLAAGLFDPHSSIRVRVLQARKQASIDRDWFKAQLAAAFQLRTPLLEGSGERLTTGCRLVHGENDGLPGMIIDLYDQTLVLKLYTAAWIPHLMDVLVPLTSLLPSKRLVLRLNRSLLEKPESLYGLQDGQLIYGEPLVGPVLFLEKGLRFETDPVQGQKTGFFLDQRDNRARIERLVKGKTVLNVFAYTGGFSVYAARGGAVKITSVDTSLPALEAAQRNFRHNHRLPAVAAVRHSVLRGDAFEVLSQMGESGQQFDVVIIDPPAFAQKKAQTAQAIFAYKKLTRLGLKVLNPGGRLVQASCSSRVEAEVFFEAVHRAASETGRPIKEIERTGHPLDHPVKFKEGAYLKCLFGIVP
jgi:23S rRNA (cytosine1962-C5)-methyltransferase